MKTGVYLKTFILRSKNRRLVLEELQKGERTQAQLHQATKLYRTHVRRTLLELMEEGLVKCPNPKDRIHKLYHLTKKGKKLLTIID